MKGAQWRVEDDLFAAREPDPVATAGWVSLAFILGTVRRLWSLLLAGAVLGAGLATAWVVVVPPQSFGTVTILLAHAQGTDPVTAMATDVQLLTTRSVAARVIDDLGLDTTPEALLEGIHSDPPTSSVLRVQVKGTDPDDAVARARSLATAYLDYRSQELGRQSRAVIDGYRQQVGNLQSQADDLTRQYDVLTSREGESAESAELLSRRGQLLNEITGLQNQIEDQTLETNAVVTASRVVDEPALVRQSRVRRTALALGSGVVGGLGLALGLVLLYAVTTGRLRSRADVAAAMDLPVVYSAGKVLPRRGRRGRRRAAALDVLVDGLATALPVRQKRVSRLGVVGVDCEPEAAALVASLARRLAGDRSVLVVDVAATGLLEPQLRSDGVAVATGPTSDAVTDVLLAVAPFEIGRGLGHLRATASRWVILVKAGTATAERLGTVARASRAAGLDVAFVMLVDADPSDASFGGGVGTTRPARQVTGS